MGCDIHVFLEWNESYNDERKEWYVVNVAQLHISRDYLLFSVLSGTRNYLNLKPVSEPKGLPDKISYVVLDKYTLSVPEKGENECEDYNCCSFEQGMRYVERYGWFNEKIRLVRNPDWHSASWLNVDELKKAQDIYFSIPNEYPDIKMLDIGEEIPEGYKKSEMYSWVSKKGKFVVEEIDPGLMGKHVVLESIIKMMEVLNDGDVSRSKLVFWYDN